MKAICNREGLLTAFQIASSVVPARSPKPILQNVKLEIQADGRAMLMATDLELGMRYRVSGVTTEQEGVVILPTSEFIAILRELGDETFVLEETSGGISVTGATSKFKLQAEDPLQFPDVPDFGDAPVCKIRASMLGLMIRRTTFAVGEMARWALHSVNFSMNENNQAYMVATNAKRMAFMPGSMTLEGTAPAAPALVPPKALTLVQKVLHDPEEEVAIGLRENEILFRTGKVTVYSRLVEGRYPNYQDVFPKKIQDTINLTASRFAAALRQAKIVTTEESHGVNFQFSEGMLTLVSAASDVGESEVRLPISYEGEEFSMAFDPTLILEALRVLDGDQEISFCICDDRRKAVIKTTDGYVYMMMTITKERAKQ